MEKKSKNSSEKIRGLSDNQNKKWGYRGLAVLTQVRNCTTGTEKFWRQFLKENAKDEEDLYRLYQKVPFLEFCLLFTID